MLAQLRLCHTSGPFIVVAPLATITNWIKEFQKWLPSANVVLYHGNRQEREDIRVQQMPISNQHSQDFPIVITSFEIAMIDRPYLERYSYKFMVSLCLSSVVTYI